MTKDEVVKHFGSQAAVATALGIRQPSVAEWSDPLPELRQLEIERLTEGKLRAGHECDKYRVPERSDLGDPNDTVSKFAAHGA
jgi:predicted XRE-type DNA-binding protein